MTGTVTPDVATETQPRRGHLEAEAAMLGAALLGAAEGVVAAASPDDLDREAHRMVLDAIVAVHGAGETVDTVTVGDELVRRGLLDAVGGAVALHDLCDATPTVAGWRSYLRIVLEAAAARRDRAAYRQAVEALDAGSDPAEVRASLPAHDPAGPGLEPVDWTAAWDRDPDATAWIVPGLVQAGRAAALVGPAKSGKSLVALEVAAAIATGGEVLGSPVGPLGVAYLDAENAIEDVVGRLTALGYGPTDDLDQLAYFSFPRLPPLDTAEGGAALAARARRYAVELVVLDTLSRFVECDENDARCSQDLYRHAVVPLRREGVALLTIDHTGKDTTRGPRGSSAKLDAADVVWQVTARGAELLELRATHRRQLGYPATILLHRRTDPLRHVPAEAGSHVEQDVADLAARLDDLNVPTDAGRDRCRAALRDAGQRVATTLLADTIRHRKGLSAATPDEDSPQPTLTDTQDRNGQ